MATSINRPPRFAPSRHFDGLLPLLRQLDRRLTRAIAQLQTDALSEPMMASFRGLLQLNQTEVDQGSNREAVVSTAEESEAAEFWQQIEVGTPIAWLQQTFELSAFDLEVVAIALAPELERRYEQLYSYLQDDVHCKRPTVDLAFNLLCASPAEKLFRRVHFATNAPLMRSQLLHLVPGSAQPQPTLLAQELHLDPQVIHLLLGQTGLDKRLVPCCHLQSPDSPPHALSMPSSVWHGLAKLTRQYWESNRPLRLYLEGPDPLQQRCTAEALCHQVQVPLLRVDLKQWVALPGEVPVTLSLIFREAWFQNAWLYFDAVDCLLTEAYAAAYQAFLAALTTHPGIVFLSGTTAWAPASTSPLGIIPIPFPPSNFEQRRACWQTHLAAVGISLVAEDLDAIADRFRLTPHQIANAVTTACNTAHWQAICAATPPTPPHLLDLFSAARAQSSHDLAALARKIEPRYSWDDIVLPDDPRMQLEELTHQAKYRSVVYRDWGFDRKLALGKGLNVLFSGPPGTGKTMAAEIIAKELQLDLYKIDLSQVVSKYIGETEKSLNRIFTAAMNSNAILLFDEADALFGKRSEVRDAHDRYANIETSYLLQKMEEYDGVAILTTNLRSNMDEAFTRRLRFIIDFPFPTVQERRQIWQQTWTAATPLAADVDWDFLASRLEVTGASIRNIALTAAFLAASDERVVTMTHLLQAVRREYQKMGKILLSEDTGFV